MMSLISAVLAYYDTSLAYVLPLTGTRALSNFGAIGIVIEPTLKTGRRYLSHWIGFPFIPTRTNMGGLVLVPKRPDWELTMYQLLSFVATS